jgi:hypothetical protein
VADNINSKNSAQLDDTPHVGSLRWGPAVTGALYLLLVGSAALALWVNQFPGVAPQRVEVAAPWVFLAFAVFFAIYRMVMVQAKKYPAGKAFFQIGSTGLFFVLLLPRTVPAELPSDPVEQLLGHRDAEVRALAAEVARSRPEGARYGPGLVKALEDPNPRVREEAHRSLVQLGGSDLGAPGDPEAVRRWKEKYP